MQHVEFFHKDHFEKRYHRIQPAARYKGLTQFIDFFWETDFDELLTQLPQGFSDALFPNIGYTYMINLGTPFTMQLEDKKFEVKGDGFLPRHTSIECYHRTGNRIFGIKFRISPVIFEKKINFSEYREFIFPLSYLLDRRIIDQIKSADSFSDRCEIVSAYYYEMLNRYSGSLRPVQIVREILDDCYTNNNFSITVEELAAQYEISSRTLQRYFESATGISSKNALQIMRIRKAVSQIASSPETFHYSTYGYYDHSHFYKHLKQFVQKRTLTHLKPHLKLLESIHKV